MAELVPSVLLYGQAAQLLDELKDAQASGAINDTFDLIQRLAEILTKFEDNAGSPLLRYESLVETEPPNSAKANRFWTAAERDITLMQQQVDMLRAATIFSHNIVTTEVMNAQNSNARLNNKLKTLQLYSNSFDSTIMTFGDSFKSFEFVDLELVPHEERAALFNEGYVTLAQEGEMVNLSEAATVRILNTSNGFLGNNQEIEDPTGAPVDPDSGLTQYTYKSELHEYADITSMLDGEPDTWIEYERYYLTGVQKRQAANYNFVYMQEEEDGTGERVDWATRPDNGILRLGMEFDLHSISTINAVDLTPFGLEDNVNYPILIRQIQTSPNGTDWTGIHPTDVWVGTDVNLRTARTADNVVAHRALWAFAPRAARFVRIYIEQHNPIPVNVGHTYWVDRRSSDSRRIEGPIPPVTDPTLHHDDRVIGDLIQRREYFSGKRWAIGIRDLLMQQVEYTERSVLITKPMRVGGAIDRVMLEKVDIQVPDDYPPDEAWVKFFISPDEGENWYPISRVEDVYNGIPEQISFNDPLHESLRERTITNYNLERPVTAIRLKVEMSRPKDAISTSPVLKSYVVKVKRR